MSGRCNIRDVASKGIPNIGRAPYPLRWGRSFIRFICNKKVKSIHSSTFSSFIIFSLSLFDILYSLQKISWANVFFFRGNFSHNRNKPLMQLQNSHFELLFGNSVVSVNKDGKLLKIKD